ncbi:MAG: DUF5711 family protein [Oscillospiraceae bacterium]|nr:DUF5711 family protein [Oscillospiraceae bacterium]
MSGRHEQKKSQYPLRWLILGTVLILAVAGVTVWRGGTLRRDSGQEQLRKENERYTFDSGVQQVYAGLENGVAVASSTGLQILDGDGYTVVRNVVSLSTPALTAGDSAAAVYDVGGTALRVGTLRGDVTVLDTESETIYSANMNDAGWLAVVTSETGYKGCVTVYNAEMGAVYAWHSGNSYVLSARVSPDCRTLAVLTLSETGSAVQTFALSSDKEYGVYNADNQLLYDFDFLSNDKLCAVSDDGLLFFNTAGNDGGSYSFAGAFLSGYSFAGDGFATLMLSQSLSSSAGTVLTVGYGGSVTGQLLTEESVQNISVREKQVMLRYSDSAAIYTQALEEQERAAETGGAKNSVLTGKNRGFLLFSGYCEPLKF